MATGKDSGFERDFGYLMPFLDKVEQAGARLAEPGAREELARLLGGEKARWARMQALLAGAASAPAGAPAAPGASTPAVAAAAAAAHRAPGGFTVGALKKR